MSKSSIHLVALALVAGATACSSTPETLVFVTVDARAAMRPVAKLHVAVANTGGSVAQDFPVGAGDSFPRSFTVTPTGRTGDLQVTITALDDAGATLGHAAGTATIVADQRVDLAVMLEPDDFVVNRGVARTQWLSFDESLAGRQIGVAPDGTFLITWENDCPLMRCDILGRLFGPNTLPIVNGTSQSPDDFILNQAGTYTQTPTVARGAHGALVAWLSAVDANSQFDLTATLLGSDGAHPLASDLSVSASTQPEAAPDTFVREDGSFVVVWERARVTPAVGNEVRARLFGADGTALVNPVTNDANDFQVSSSIDGEQTFPFGVGLSGGGFVIAWAHQPPGGGPTPQNLRARVFSSTGTATTPNDLSITTLAAGFATTPHVAATPDGGFVIAWQALNAADPLFVDRPILARRFLASGAPAAPEIHVADKSTDVNSIPSIAVRAADGVMLLVWQDGADRGDGMGFGIRARALRPDGMPAGPDFIANTTLGGDEKAPSVAAGPGDGFLVAWTDGSVATATDMGDVRARVLYPTIDRHDGVIGAQCGAATDTACGTGLRCATATADGKMLCHPTCTVTDGTPCGEGGTCTAGVCQY